VLRIVLAPDGSDRPDVRLLIADPAWTPPAASQMLAIRDLTARVLAEHDFLAEAIDVLDAWAQAGGVAEAMTVAGTSYWYRERLGTLLWMQETATWLSILDLAITEARPATIDVDEGVDPGLRAAAVLVAARDGLELRGAATATTPEEPAEPGASESTSAASGSAPVPLAASAAPAARRSLVGRIRGRLQPDEPTRRARFVRARIATLGGERPRLLVLLAAAPQRVDTPSGVRLMNAFLGPVLERLRGTGLEPIEVDLRSEYRDDVGWARIAAPDAGRVLPADALRLYPAADDSTAVASAVAAVTSKVAEIRRPADLAGVDLGTAIAGRVADRARRMLPGMLRTSRRAERLLRDLHPAGLLLMDEYHRQDWISAAAVLGIPTAAVQHGIIYGRHAGYAHTTRPEVLRLPSRTYLFGRWERDLLVGQSAYRPDEVVVGGSPRLSLVPAPETVDRAAVRAELGIAPEDQLLVVSGTWGAIDRRFYYPAALAAIADRPLPGVHIVVKLHPSETDEGPYRAVIEGIAAARGFLPPKITVVQRVDLYRLLAASDAHFGVHSTVITEAVAAGTLNLIAAMVRGADWLGYADAGVAVPVRDGGDVLDALARRDELLPDEATRRTFTEAHFEPGDAAARIADDLLGWLS
jgi:hypothetical protein